MDEIEKVLGQGVFPEKKDLKFQSKRENGQNRTKWTKSDKMDKIGQNGQNWTKSDNMDCGQMNNFDKSDKIDNKD